jgi:tetratricopeptide (TPR) repeat protein
MMPTAQRETRPRRDVPERPVTDGTIALANLEAQIDGLQWDREPDCRSTEESIALVDLLILRGLILGRIADYGRAEEIAEQLVHETSNNGAVFLARARVRAVFHRFTDALNDLAVAERLSPGAGGVNGERAAILQALGRYDEAHVIREEAAERRPDFEAIAALAGLCADRGQIEAARRLHAEARWRYCGVSPFPLALLEFQLGHMWMHCGQWDEACNSFGAALRLVPAYAPALGHLAEVEAGIGNVEMAIARLYPLTHASDDPDYAAQLARILCEAGRTSESSHWRKFAAARYDELVAIHPEAFADHAAEFWLGVGADPNKALTLAKTNLGLRKTPRAYELFSQAISANEAVGATRSATSLQARAKLRRRHKITIN